MPPCSFLCICWFGTVILGAPGAPKIRCRYDNKKNKNTKALNLDRYAVDGATKQLHVPKQHKTKLVATSMSN